MPTQAESVESSISELERLTELGVISQELSHHLLTVMNISRTGRLFGHDSAVLFPKKILEMTEACTELLNENQCNVDEIKETFSKKFASRARKPTELNRVISSIVSEIRHSPKPSILTGAGPTKKNWFLSLFQS